MRVLGSSGARRTSSLPDVPTIAEQGLAGFEASSWYGMVAPAGTPAPVVAALTAEVAKILKAPDVLARIRQLGAEPGQAFGAEFTAFMQVETKKWAGVIRASGATAD